MFDDHSEDLMAYLEDSGKITKQQLDDCWTEHAETGKAYTDILEDSGYMSRAAFIMDGIMRTFGLQGRSFVPLVLGFGCTVPAILASPTISPSPSSPTPRKSIPA